MTRKLRIVSGGQSGADTGGLTAALAAIERGMPVETGGWGHAGFITEYAKTDPIQQHRLAEIQKKAGLQVKADARGKEVAWVRVPGEGRYNGHYEFIENEDPRVVDVWQNYGNQPRFGLTKHFPRTARNVVDSDATVLFGDIQGGTLDTLQIAKYLQRPYIVNPTPEQLASFIKEGNIQTLNVAGRRESKSPRGRSLERDTHAAVLGALERLYPEQSVAPQQAAKTTESGPGFTLSSPSVPESAKQLELNMPFTGSVPSAEERKTAADPRVIERLGLAAAGGLGGAALAALLDQDEPEIIVLPQDLP